jgi:hypothetical protein
MFLKCYFPTLKCYKGAHVTFLQKTSKNVTHDNTHVHFNVGLLPQTRTLLSAWLKQDRDWRLANAVGKGRLGLTDFLPEGQNNFEAAFSRVKVWDVFALRSPLGTPLTLTLEKSH